MKKVLLTILGVFVVLGIIVTGLWCAYVFDQGLVYAVVIMFGLAIRVAQVLLPIVAIVVLVKNRKKRA